MHRISLRGPWHLAAQDGRMEASRKFHAPPGLATDHSDQAFENRSAAEGSVQFGWRSTIEWPIDQLRLNETLIWEATSTEEQRLGTRFFFWDSEAGVGRVELTGILRPFNELVLVWRRWPAGWQNALGRYLPDPQHPFHFDSWLEIQT